MNAANAPLHASALENERRAHEPSMEEILASIRKIIADDDALPLSRPMSEPRATLSTPRPFESNVTPIAPPPAESAKPATEPAPATVPAPAPVREAQHAPPPPVHVEAPVATSAITFAVEAPVEKRAAAPVAEKQAPVAVAPPVLNDADLASFAEIANELTSAESAEEEHAPAPAHGAPEASPPDLRPSLAGAAEFGRRSSFDAADASLDLTSQEQAPRDLASRTHESDIGAILSAEANASVASAFQALSASVQMTSSETIERHVRELLRPMLKQWLDDNLPVMVERMVRAEIERVARGGR